MELFQIIRALNGAFGPSGDESDIASVIKQMAQPYVDEVSTDVMGNLICHKKGNGPRVMFAAHMDSLGFVVTHIEKDGYLRVAAVGGIHPESVLYTPVRFKNGVCGLVAVDADVNAGKIQMNDLYIDIGAKSIAEAEELVSLGDVAVYDTQVSLQGDFLISPYLDNRISCAVQLLAMKKLGKTDNDLYFVFTAQEEVGTRGAKTSTYAIDPLYGIVLDVTGSADIPKSDHSDSSAQGKGAAIKVMDHSVICSSNVVKTLQQLAEDKGIPHHLGVKRTGGTDAGAMQPTRSGVLVGGICVPCRYMHTPTESVRVSDALACVDLVCAFAETNLEKE